MVFFLFSIILRQPFGNVTVIAKRLNLDEVYRQTTKLASCCTSEIWEQRYGILFSFSQTSNSKKLMYMLKKILLKITLQDKKLIHSGKKLFNIMVHSGY